VPVADNTEATGGVSRSNWKILARWGAFLCLLSLARAKKVRRPPVREPA